MAWDNLGGPRQPPRSPAARAAPPQSISESGCPADPAARTTVPITKPALGMSADYFLPPTPNTSLPDPNAKSTWSHNYSKAGVDTGEIIIRGGSHLDFSFIPNQAFGASYYGPDLIDWYTTAWFDKYLKHQASADKMLLSQRWRNYLARGGDRPQPRRQRAFLLLLLAPGHPSGERQACGTARTCVTAARAWSRPARTATNGNYSYFSIDTTPDSRRRCRAPATAGRAAYGTSSRSHHRPPAALPRPARITKVVVYVGRRLRADPTRPMDPRRSR